jgi:hypothetical protein
MPTLNAPETTVTISGWGWVCGAMLYPAGTFRRMTNKPSLVGSPCNTAACAPAGSDGGPGVQLTCSALTILCTGAVAGSATTLAGASLTSALSQPAAARPAAATKTILFIIVCLPC